MNRLWIWGWLGAMLLAQPALADPDPEALARQWCANCHGADGNSVSPLFPRIAGQQAGYLRQQLTMFRDQTRSDAAAHDYMWGVAGGLSDAEIAGVAAFFAGQAPMPNPAMSDPARIAAGQAIYQNGKGDAVPACLACHGLKAEGTEQAPRLAGQHAAYLLKQLHVFNTSQRPSAVAMQAIIKSLDEEELRALAAYLQSR